MITILKRCVIMFVRREVMCKKWIKLAISVSCASKIPHYTLYY